MLKLTLEAEIFLDFINTQPKQFPEGSLEEHSYWNAFFTFIKSGANLDLINNNKLDNSIFLIGLSTGRKGTKINIIENFNKPHKYKLPKETPFENIYFLNETSREQGEKYRSVNSFAFGFLDDYVEIWNKLSVESKVYSYAVRKNTGSFNNWSIIEQHLIAFSDIVIADSYILSDISLIQSNLLKILLSFQSINPNGFSLSIITYEGSFNSKINIDDCYNNLKQLIFNNNISCKFELIFSTNRLKEHDRGIFTNYLRIKSGDSFNYFNSKNEIITKGTEIDFIPLIKREYYKLAQITLQALNEIKITAGENQKRGECDNKLLDNIC